MDNDTGQPYNYTEQEWLRIIHAGEIIEHKFAHHEAELLPKELDDD